MKAKNILEEFDGDDDLDDKDEVLSLIRPDPVWIAMVHRHPREDFLFAAHTLARVTEKLAKYCRRNWHDVSPLQPPKHGPNDDPMDIVKAYFDEIKQETYTIRSYRVQGGIKYESILISVVYVDSNTYAVFPGNSMADIKPAIEKFCTNDDGTVDNLYVYTRIYHIP